MRKSDLLEQLLQQKSDRLDDALQSPVPVEAWHPTVRYVVPQVDDVAAEGTRMVSEIVHATHRAATGECLIGWVLLGRGKVSD